MAAKNESISLSNGIYKHLYCVLDISRFSFDKKRSPYFIRSWGYKWMFTVIFYIYLTKMTSVRQIIPVAFLLNFDTPSSLV